MARGEKLRIALTASVCASGEESSKDSLVRRFGVSKDSFAYVGAFVTWRTHMRRVFADCSVSGAVHRRALRNCAREALQRAALDAR